MKTLLAFLLLTVNTFAADVVLGNLATTSPTYSGTSTNLVIGFGGGGGGGGGGAAFVQSSSVSGGTITLASTVGAGHIIVVTVRSATLPAAPTSSLGNTYVMATNITFNSSAGVGAIFVATNINSGTEVISGTGVYYATEYAGVHVVASAGAANPSSPGSNNFGLSLAPNNTLNSSVVEVSCEDNAGNLSTIAFDSAPMTGIISNAYQYVGYVVSPAPGAHTVAVSGSPNVVPTCATYVVLQ